MKQFLDDLKIVMGEGKMNFFKKLFKCLSQRLKFLLILNQQVNQLYNQGKFNEAIVVAEQALTLAKTLHANDHLDVATSLNNLALLYNSQGRLEDAEPLYLQALDMRKRLFPGDHPNVAASLNNLVSLYNSQGRLEEAEPLLLQALDMTKRLFPGDHPDVAISLNNLVSLYNSQGRLGEAEPLYLQALDMRKRLFPGNHPDVANSLNNLASLYHTQGRLGEAEPLFLQALDMRKRLFPGNQPDVANSLHELALLYHTQGRLGEAEPLFLQALDMTKRLFPGDHSYVAICLNSLGHLYHTQGRLGEAEPLFLQALDMRKRLFPGNQPDVANSLNSLASLYHTQGRLGEAEPLYFQALDMTKRLFPGDHNDAARCLNNLAMLYQAQGRLREAEPLYIQALDMTKRLFPGDHSSVAICLNNLGSLLLVTNKHQEAFEKMYENIVMETRLIQRNFAFSSEKERLESIKSKKYEFDAFLSLVSKYFSNSSEQVQQTLDVVLKRKSITAAALAQLNFAIHSQRYSHLKPKFNQLRSLQEQLFYRQKNLPIYDPEAPKEIYQIRFEQYQKDLAELNQQCQQLEKELSTEIPEMNLEHQTIDRRAIALELPDNNVLVEYVQFKRYDFTAPKGQEWKSPEYWAFILPPQHPDQVQMISLGAAQPIDDLIHKVRQVLIMPENDGYSTSARKGKTKDETLKVSLKKYEYQLESAHDLRKKIFTPLVPILQNYQNILIAPDGELSLIPFGALPTEQPDKLLSDRYQISYLSSGRDLLRWKIKTDRTASESFIIANPNFDYPAPPKLPESAPKTPLQTEDIPNPKPKFKNLSSAPEFPPLPETETLAKKLATKLNIPNLYLQDQALETLFTATTNPRILVIATHGDYEAKDEQTYPQENSFDRLITPPKDNPMIRSYLALAGANTSRQGQTLPPEAGKGILSAEDIAAIDLWENELTILIACQTGLGEVVIGEGVFGLRRAFAIAGCKALIMSLWSVPTLASLLLMDEFINQIQQGVGKRAALVTAQNYLRTITIETLQTLPTGDDILKEFIEQRIISEEYIKNNPNYQLLSHPYFWRAWISQGEF